MTFTNVVNRWFKPRLPEQDVRTEADRLLCIWGETAFYVARNLSTREAAGLLQTTSPGFWGGVVHEIGHRIGIPDNPILGRNLLVL